MSLNLQLPPQQQQTMRPIITVVGVGGAGGNAVNNMISAQLEGVQFVIANTDAQALEGALTEQVIQLGRNITQGLGAGATPEIGQAAAEEAADDIQHCIDGSHMVFITAGMGGGTGTGAAPVVARMAREQGMLTVGVITKPFQFEGGKRMHIAEQGIAELQKYVDTLIVIPNQNLFRVANEKTTFADAFRMADEVLHSGVRGVTDLMVKPGLVNLDFADIRTIMQEMGKAMMGTGEASGEKRAVDAAEAAISNPLLDDVSLRGARAALINITGGADMTLYEVDEAANRIREEIDSDANIIFGSTFHESMQGTMRVSVVATGIDIDPEQLQQSTSSVRHQHKPAAKQNFKPAPTYFAARKPAVQAPASAASTSEQVRDDMAIDTNRTAPAASASYESTANRSAMPEPSAPSKSPNEYSQDMREEDAGPLFVSPSAGQPASRNYQQFDAETSRTPETSEHHQQGGSFGILSRIADVGRSLNTRSEAPSTQPRAVEVRSRQVAPETTNAAPARGQEAESFDEYSQHEEENYYDIPAFLRRQAT